MIKVTANNREKLARYIELLDNFITAAGDYRLSDIRNEIDPIGVISVCREESAVLKKQIAEMNGELTEELFLSMVHPGDVIRIYPRFYDKLQEAMGNGERCTVIRVIDISNDIGGWRNHGGKNYIIEYEEMYITSDHRIRVYGKDLECTSRGMEKTNLFKSLTSVCQDLLDGLAVKTDMDEWNELVEVSKHMDEVTEKYMKFTKK